MSRPPGFVFMFGIDGTDVDPSAVQLLRDTGACGVCLLGRNIESPEQLKALIDGTERALERKLLWAVDHEGGWVVRFRRGVTPFPGNMALGHAARRWPEAPALQGRVMASQLRACGVTINFAPVLDVVTADYSPGITIRSLGNSPQAVAEAGTALLRAMQQGGVHATVKHFPGKGASRQDAHVTLPTVDVPLDTLRRREFVPFAAAVQAGVSLVMSSHVYYPALDGADPRPATFSGRAVEILRKDIGFDGTLITDDLGMGAIVERGGVGEAGVCAATAGHDILLICHDEAAQRGAHQDYVETWRGGAAWERSVARIERLLAAPASPAEALDGEELALKIARASVRVERDPMGLLPLGYGTAVVVPAFQTLVDRYAFEEDLLRPGDIFAEHGGVELVEVPMEPEEDEITKLALGLRGRTVALLCFDALRYERQRRLVIALQSACPRLVLVPIRNPWDAQLVRPETTVVHAWGFRASNLRAVAELLFRRKA